MALMMSTSYKALRAPASMLEAAVPNQICSKNTLARAGRQKEFENDGPGDISLQGFRHDNDHTDITRIQILPTMDEILSERMPYMPRKQTFAFHTHKIETVKRYIDTQFRQLRYESIASVIDACLCGFRLAVGGKHSKADFRQETPVGIKYYWLEKAAFEMSLFHSKSGAMFQLSYDCPSPFQGPRKMTNAPFLREGMLCALLAVHEETQELNVVFLQVEQTQSTEAMRSKTGGHQRAAVQVVLADPDDISKATQLASYHRGYMEAKFYLVDMPTILVPSFLSHLKILQKLFVDGNFAFEDYLAAEDPTAKIRTDEGIFLPGPVDVAAGTRFNLNCLKKDEADSAHLEMAALPLHLNVNKDRELQAVKNRSTLDDGQAVALFESLSRELAFTQGPPGTGKTFLGIALVETILKSRNGTQKPAPIVVVCQTNHALDDFLDGLIKRDVTKISRIGAGSTSKWIGPYLLRNQRSKRHASCKEISTAGRLRSQVEFQGRLALDFAEALNEKTFIPWILIDSYMAEYHAEIHKHFTTLDKASTQKANQDLRSAKMRNGFAFMYWQEGGDIKDANGLINAFDNMLGESHVAKEWSSAEIALLKAEVAKGFQAGVEMALSDGGCRYLWSLDQDTRIQLAGRWFDEIHPRAVCEAFGELQRRFLVARHDQRVGFDDFDLATIQELGVEVVGMTSTACATMHSLLQKLAPQVMVFEEASELIEAHSAIALVPSVKHCIQIGDPLQLRPHVEQQKLSIEYSDAYRLDESLFERFMKAKVPFAQLNTQRRAHPEIADLLRVGDYPYLMDHPDTFNRPKVAGLSARMWWLDHKHPEDSPDRLSALSKSSSNQYEVKFVTALVRYLVEKQNYKFHEITILTPYKGQLAALQKDLSQLCSVSLTAEDRNELIDADLIEDKDFADGTSLDVALSDLLRIATIDNYQGEQARVIIFSAVRSNSKDAMGFLANRNRTNVAISRAEDGLFVIGNAALMEKNEHWRKVVSSFRMKGAIGPFLTTKCHQHPTKTWAVTNPADFQYAICEEQCGQELPCGHTCDAPCHLQDMHHDGRMPCSKPCAKNRDCGHGCDRLCSQRCGSCKAPIESIVLNCGHPATLKCGERAETIACTKVLDSISLECGHSHDILCSDRGSQLAYRCSETCASKLSCGHPCPLRCYECQGQKHAQMCKEACGCILECGHFCQQSCHPGDCPTCQQPCEKYCQHGRCQHPCYQTCKICVELVVDEACPHSNTANDTRLCCLPSLQLPCSRPCTKLLACGLHLCPSICGEICPPNCDQCASGAVPSSEAIITLACGHTFSVSELDEAFGFQGNFTFGPAREVTGITIKHVTPNTDFRCPECSYPAINTRRYDLMSSLPNLTATMERLIVYGAKRLLNSFWDIHMGEQILFAGLEKFLSNLKTGPMSMTINQCAINERCHRIIDAQQNMSHGAKTCVVRIEKSIEELCTALNNQEMFPPIVFCFGLRCDLLYHRSRLALIDFAYHIARHFAETSDSALQNRLMIKGYTAHAVEQAAGECTAISEKIAECECRNLKRLEVEMRIIQMCYWNILGACKATDKVALDVSMCLARIDHLIECYPRTAGLFEAGYQSVRNSMQHKRLPPRYHFMCSESMNDIWHRFGDFKVGELTRCQHGHVYSRMAFPQGCPECGLVIQHVVPESFDRKNVIPLWESTTDNIDVNAFVAKVQAVAFTVRT